MLKRQIDLSAPQKAVTYARMSSDNQNPRSPDQQLEQIQRILERLRLPYTVCKTYRDDARSGLYVARRPSFCKMIHELKSGIVPAKLILVDSRERFGRADEVELIREDLRLRYGILVLTADTNFADPTSTSGKILSAVESVRATEHGRLKAYEVVRGKRDTANLKRWPGGPAPFGYRLEPVLVESKGRTGVDHHVLVPNRTTRWIVVWSFAKAFELGWGQTRIAKALNEHPEISNELKPFLPSTVGRWLDSEIYCGVLVWAEHATGIVNDVRVLERNNPQNVLRVEGFCEPLVDPPVAARVREQRRARGERLRQALAAKSESRRKMPGLIIKHMLTGLVRCGHCGRSMTATSSSEYVTVGGESRRYVNYRCVEGRASGCPNKASVPEEWLRTAVIEHLCNRLFPGLLELA